MRFYVWDCRRQILPLLAFGLLIFLSHPLFSQQYVADHSIAKEEILRSIPEEYINLAREELVIAYQHTSHGTHVSRGMFGLPDYKAGDNTLFAISLNHPETGKLCFLDDALEEYPPGARDLSVGEETFVETTRNFLDADENADVNVVMWAWCDISGHDVAGNYLPGMETLIAEYGEGGSRIGTGEGLRERSVTFIFMTGHANGYNVGEDRPKNLADTIISYCNAQGYLCLDYYYIDTHDMDDNYWEDANDDGESDDYGGGFYQDFQDAHSVGDGYYENLGSPGGSVEYGSHTTQHITSNRKAYAMWWILARIAGWDGTLPAMDVVISTEDNTNQVVTGRELQLSGTVEPEHSAIQEVSWRVVNNEGTASISEEGLLRGGQPGPVQVIALALDGSGVADTLDLVVAEAPVPLTQITVYPEEGIQEPDVGAAVQYVANTLPASATNHTVIWGVNNLSGSAVMDEDGKLTTQSAGVVEVIALAEDGSGVTGILPVTIQAAAVMVSGIHIAAEGDIQNFYTGNAMQFTATVSPENASNTALLWSVNNLGGSAQISAEGLLTALSAGDVEVIALAEDGSGVTGILTLSIQAAAVMVSGINILAEGDIQNLYPGNAMQFTASVSPENASNPAVQWTVNNLGGAAQISAEGLLTALSEGDVEVIALAEDGSGVTGILTLSIQAAAVMVADISILAEGDVQAVDEGSTLQFTASVWPENASNPLVLWSVVPGSGSASINENGLLTALSEGEVDVVASALDGSGISSTFALTIYGSSGLTERDKGSMLVYPNPSSGKFYVDPGDLEIDRLEVLSILGSVVLVKDADPGDPLIELDLSDQQEGFFFVKAISGEERSVRRIYINK